MDRNREAFRKRFLRWKNGEKVYDNGRPAAIQEVDKSDADFAKRLRSNWREEIWDWEKSGKSVTHKIAGADNIVYPNVLTTKGGGLIDFTNPIWQGNVDPYERAIKNNDYVPMKTEEDAIWFGPNYKKYYPGFKDGKFPKYGDGTVPLVDELKQLKVEQWSDDWQSRLQRSAGSKVLLKWNATGLKPKPESSEEYTKRRIKETTWKKSSGRKVIDAALDIAGGDVKQALDAGNAAIKGDYTEAALLGAGLLLPTVVSKAIKNGRGIFRRIGKSIKRATEYVDLDDTAFKGASGSGNPIGTDIYSAADKAAKKIAHTIITPSGKEKAAFSQAYIRKLSDNPTLQQLGEKSILDFLDAGFTKEQAVRMQQLGSRHPEYLDYLLQTDKDPFAQETVDDFLRRQFTSIRGVHANNKEEAIQYLTTTEKGRALHGGDRMRTNGGLYTSNAPNIADRFKNPEIGTQNGYVGVVHVDPRIPRDIPIEDLLELYRRRIYPEHGINPMEGTQQYFDALKDIKADPEVLAIEGDYIGRAARGLPGQERAYLPHGEGVLLIATIEDLQEFANQVNQAGRWGNGVDGAGDASKLFIPRQLNAYSDFIRIAKQFLKPRDGVIKEVYDPAVNEIQKHFWDQYYKAFNLRAKLRNRLMIAKLVGLIAGIIGVGVPTGYGIGKLIQKIRHDEAFVKSLYFNEMLKDKRITNDIDDDSLLTIENEYYDKFLKARKNGEKIKYKRSNNREMLDEHLDSIRSKK